MSDLIYRQRRRFILVALFTCLPMTVLVTFEAYQNLRYASFSYIMSEPNLLVWIYLAYALILSALNAALLFLPALLIVFARRWRGFIEGSALGFGLALLITWTLSLFDESTLIAQYQIPLAWILFFAALHLRVHDRVLPKLRYKARASYTSRKSAEQLWAELVPAPAYADQHWNASLIQITDDPADPARRTAIYDLLKFELHQTMQITQDERPHHFAYRYENAPVGKIAAYGGNYDIRIEDLEFARKVTFEMVTDKLPFSQWMVHWFGDILGDQADYLVTQETGKRDYTTTGAAMRKITKAQSGSISPISRAA